MKKGFRTSTSNSPRPEAQVSSSTERLLRSYALAASAAGVGALALVAPAEAKIVYTPAHHVIKHGGTFKLDLNHDGVTDFTLKLSVLTNCSTFISQLLALPAAGNGVEGWTGFQAYASALKSGHKIGPLRYFPGRQMASVDAGPGGTYEIGSWVNVKDRFLGLKFKIKGKTHYGWARLNVQVANLAVTATLSGYAYETEPGKAIKAGATEGSDVIAMQGSLGDLARGAWTAQRAK